MILIRSKSLEVHVVELFINSADFTLDQKLEILEFQQNPISSKFLESIAHLEGQLMHTTLLSLNQEYDKSHKFGIFRSYLIQPNNSLRFLRNIMVGTIQKYDSPIITIANIAEYDKSLFKNVKFYSQNVQGILILNIVIPILVEMPKMTLRHKNRCNQLLIVREILLYKKKTGALPKDLDELNLPKHIVMDKDTGEPFLYFAENGILQNVRGSNDCIELTTKKLTHEEIKLIIDEKLRGNTVFYLK
jgi:hypothetical protein